MPATERLYYNDSHLAEFEARVLEKTERVSGWTAVLLDRTAFYPTGGGQPSDTGTLDGERVVECIDDENHGVLHVIQGRAPDVGSIVRGRIDWPRRLDHIQQHTGQHILSQAFVTLFAAPTRGFRVLHDVCEIDVELANPTNEAIERAVELANNVVWEDREINIRNVTPEEAAQLPLRKDPSRDGELRLIEIDGFDLTPCGGTHAYRTGEVGMLAVRSWERAKGLTRIEFVAGARALNDYRRANKTARTIAALFSAGRDDTPKLAARMIEENKELHRRLRSLEEIADRVEAEELLKQALSEPPASAGGAPSPASAGGASSPASAGGASSPASAGGASSSPASAGGAPSPASAGGAPSPASAGGASSPASAGGASPTASAGGASSPASAGGVTTRIIAKVLPDRDAESLKRLALALIAHPKTVALLGSKDKEAARLVFGRSADAPGDMNALMKEACALLDGRGGGKPDLAQGGGKNVDRLEEAIESARSALLVGTSHPHRDFQKHS